MRAGARGGRGRVPSGHERGDSSPGCKINIISFSFLISSLIMMCLFINLMNEMNKFSVQVHGQCNEQPRMQESVRERCGSQRAPSSSSRRSMTISAPTHPMLQLLARTGLRLWVRQRRLRRARCCQCRCEAGPGWNSGLGSCAHSLHVASALHQL